MKYLFDLSLITLTAVIWLPLLIIISLFILIFDGSPIFFTQERCGLKGKVFSIIKFRTMENSCIKDNQNIKTTQDITKLGHVLRRSSLDEIPELINVIRGEMSIVGPRPFIAEYKNFYNEFQNRRHNVLPGITGWAQVNGRNLISWEKKFEYDLWYVNNYSFLLDLKIILLTFKSILNPNQIYTNGKEIPEKFKGD
jgi:lipopolysaccharide/colanic/teichoic acid biosynthesis glycosyltransferase